MQELRLAAVSEDGTYAVLTAPGRSGRFSLPIDDRLRIVARGQFSRLAQYEIEVESPLRPKEIQDRIRAGETAEEIADAAGVPIERVRRFEGPVLAERAYRAQEAQRASIRHPGDSGPGRRLGDVVTERLTDLGADTEDAEWDSRKRADGNWQVSLMFSAGDHPRLAEWVFDPRSRHASPADDTAAGLCLPHAELPPSPSRQPGSATVTPIASRLSTAPADYDPRPQPEPAHVSGPQRAAVVTEDARPAADAQPEPPLPGRERPARKAAGGRSRRSSVPSWDEIMFGTSRQPD
ncbi:MAG TPA: septation protein SepH [Streptosporangiaceae bacterium]|nr:septation protein SepH [Streptosporangiaceae bacterium]